MTDLEKATKVWDDAVEVCVAAAEAYRETVDTNTPCDYLANEYIKASAACQIARGAWVALVAERN